MGTAVEPLTEENRRIRLLRMAVDLLIQMLMTRTVSTAEAEDMIRGVRNLAADLFPGKDHVFDLVYMPRFRRALREGGVLGGRPSLRLLDRLKSSEGGEER